MCIQLLLVSVLLLAFVSPFSSSREFSGFTPHAFKLLHMKQLNTAFETATFIMILQHFLK